MIKIKKGLFISVYLPEITGGGTKVQSSFDKKKVLLFFEVVKDRTKGWDTANSA